MAFYLPVLVVVLSNTFYHICAKSMPANADSFAALTVTYQVGAAATFVLYLLTRKGSGFVSDFRALNWTAFVLGLAVVGLEAGFLWMYRIGWEVSTAQIVQSAVLAGVLLFVGLFLYKEPIHAKKIAGLEICLVGLYLLN